MSEGKEAQQVPVTVRVKGEGEGQWSGLGLTGPHQAALRITGSADPQGLGVGGVSRFEWRSVT